MTRQAMLRPVVLKEETGARVQKRSEVIRMGSNRWQVRRDAKGRICDVRDATQILQHHWIVEPRETQDAYPRRLDP
jgi:hypothetical protein